MVGYLAFVGFVCAMAYRPAVAADPLFLTCLTGAAAAHRLEPAVVLAILKAEGGKVGEASPNSNGTFDYGPMQVNTINLPTLARHWGVSRDVALAMARDDLCSSLDAGSLLLRQAIDLEGGDFWQGMGRYHSATPAFKNRYLGRLAEIVARLN